MIGAMRSLLVSLSILLAAVSMRLCGSDEEADEEPPIVADPPETVGARGSVTVDARPAHGGTVVVAEGNPVEVVPHASGEIYAYAPAGAARPARVDVRVPVRGGSPRTVQLAWRERSHRFEGRVTGVVIVPGPLAVFVTIGGRVVDARADTFVVLPAIVIVQQPVPVIEVHEHHKHRKHRKHRDIVEVHVR